MEYDRQEGEVERRRARERVAIQRHKVDHDDWKKGEGKAQQPDQSADGRRIDAEPEIPAEISLDEVPHAWLMVAAVANARLRRDRSYISRAVLGIADRSKPT
jgi:hypothetical protein